MKPGTSTDAYWSYSATDLLAKLQSASNGLSTTESRERLQQVGPNLLKPRRRDTALRSFIAQFTSPLVLILIFAAVVSAIAGEWTDAAIVVAIVVASAVLSFAQGHTASHAVEKLRAQVTIKATVMRDGPPQFIPAEEIVPSDIVLLSAGSLIPADGIVLEARDFFVDQAKSAVGDVSTEVHYELIEGAPAEAIIKVATIRKCNVIVMGSRGLSELSGLVLGNTSHKVISLAPCPVLIARQLIPKSKMRIEWLLTKIE